MPVQCGQELDRAGVVYLRAVYTDTTVSTSVLLAKTKVTPISGSTIPRKELNGTQLLSKILITVANVLSIPLQMSTLGAILRLCCAGFQCHRLGSSRTSATE